MTGIPGGKSTPRAVAIYDTAPIRIPDGLLDAFPGALRPALQVIIDGARKKFQKRWYFQEAVDYLLTHMQAVFSKAVKSAEEAGSTLKDVEALIDRLATANPGRDSAATEELKRKWRESDAWSDFTRAMERAGVKDRRQRHAGGGDA
jgi:hypothetical protein